MRREGARIVVGEIDGAFARFDLLDADVLRLLDWRAPVDEDVECPGAFLRGAVAAAASESGASTLLGPADCCVEWARGLDDLPTHASDATCEPSSADRPIQPRSTGVKIAVHESLGAVADVRVAPLPQL